MRTAQQAGQAFENQQYNKVGMCLWECQETYRAPHLYPSAIAQWEAAKVKHTGRNAPYGAPMYYRGGKYGHIVLYVGNGKVRSTDAAGAGRMGTVPIDWFKANWGYTYLGWSEDIGGQPITFKGEEDMPLSDKDIEKIAKAVWAFAIEDPVGEDNGVPVKNDTDHASTMLKNIRKSTA